MLRSSEAAVHSCYKICDSILCSTCHGMQHNVYINTMIWKGDTCRGMTVMRSSGSASRYDLATPPTQRKTGDEFNVSSSDKIINIQSKSRFLYNNKCPLNVNDVLVYGKIPNGDEVIEMSRQQSTRWEGLAANACGFVNKSSKLTEEKSSNNKRFFFPDGRDFSDEVQNEKTVEILDDFQ
ncbi:hypothetical protein ABVT39_016179 [Epinephelus coioides]